MYAGDKDSATKLVIKYKWQVDGKDLVYDDSVVWSEQAHSLIFLKTEVESDISFVHS